MRKLLFSLSLIASGFAANAQQDPQFSNFMYDRLSINPGFAGIDNKVCATVFYRNQWMGFGNQPQTFLFNGHAPIPVIRGGLGLTFYSDKLGFQKNTAARLAYSFHLPLAGGKMKLGIGASVGFMGVAYQADWIAVDPVADDNAIPSETSSAGTMDFSFGLYLKGKDFYVGLSSTHLTESELKKPAQFLSFKNKRHYYVMAGWDKQLNADFAVLPAIRIESDAVATQVDASARCMWRDMAWLGLGYRVKEAIYPMLGVQLDVWKEKQGKFRFGTSYDINTNELKNYSNNGLEFFVNFCFSIEPVFKPEKYKTVRFL